MRGETTSSNAHCSQAILDLLIKVDLPRTLYQAARQMLRPLIRTELNIELRLRVLQAQIPSGDFVHPTLFRFLPARM